MEGVRKAVLAGQATLRERRLGGLDHLHRAAGIHLVRREIRKIRKDGFVNQTGAPAPPVVSLRIGEHGDKLEIRVLQRPLLRQLAQIKVGAPANAPVQHHLALQAAVEGVFKHALDGRKAG